MWSYYGAKTNIVHLYPKPLHDKIIEPFAGTARYSLRYFEKEVILIDKYEVIVKIWKWLQKCSPKDVMDLPTFNAGDNINDHIYDCEEQRFLVGFLVGFGFTDPRQTATPRLRNRPNAMNYTKKKISESLFKIRHWKIVHASFEDIPNETATWFIDPPYQFGGEHYKFSSKKIDFLKLADYCRSRIGQTIVCESNKATWMPFYPIVRQNVLSGFYNESMWTNMPTSMITTQQQLFI